MAELISMTYEQARAEHFKSLKDEAKRKMNYWATRAYRSRPNYLNDPASIKASEYAAEYSYYNDALEALEDNRFQYETGFVKGFEAAQPKWISVEENPPKAGETVQLLWKRASGRYHAVCGYMSLLSDIAKTFRFHILDYNIYAWEDVTHWAPLLEAPKEEA